MAHYLPPKAMLTMDPQRPNLDDLTSLAVEVFESAVRALAKSFITDGPDLRPKLSDIVTAIDGAISLSDRERARRIEAVLGSLQLIHSDFEEIAAHAANLLPASKNAVMAHLPEGLRPKVHPGQSDSSLSTTTGPESVPATPVLPSSPSTIEGLNENNSAPQRAVLLLGTEQEHASNTHLLKRAGITPLRLENIGDLETILRSGLAGIVVASSLWTRYAVSEHETIMLRLLKLSSVLFLRLDVDGLEANVAAQIHQMRRDLCYADIDASLFCQGSGCRLSPTDIQSIEGISTLLDASTSTRFHPHEISSSEGLLVRIAATKHVRGNRFDQGLKLEQLHTSFFVQGRSYAKVLLASPNDGGSGFVMKIDDAGRLREEMKTYYKYASGWDGRTCPELHYHGDAAAIIFTLVDTPGVPGSPAPTLDAQLEKAMNAELGSWGEQAPNEEDLTVAIERAADKLATLNTKSADDDGAGYTWIATTLTDLAGKGIQWTIEDTGSRAIDIPGLTSRAAEIVRPLQDCAVVHGDVHLMNILVRDDRDPCFIDYVHSGPGHPCNDLARLEAALMYKKLSQIRHFPLTPESSVPQQGAGEHDRSQVV